MLMNEYVSSTCLWMLVYIFIFVDWCSRLPCSLMISWSGFKLHTQMCIAISNCYACIRICAYVYICVHAYVCIHMYTCTCIYSYTHMYTYTFKYKHNSSFNGVLPAYIFSRSSPPLSLFLHLSTSFLLSRVIVRARLLSLSRSLSLHRLCRHSEAHRGRPRTNTRSTHPSQTMP